MLRKVLILTTLIKFFNEGPIFYANLDQPGILFKDVLYHFEPSDVVPLNVKVTTAEATQYFIDPWMD
jgi:hypothetical protein